MIAKLVVHAPTREAAMDKMIRAIEEYQIVGIQTTLGFCRFVMKHEAFRTGNFDTHFVKQHFEPEMLKEPLTEAEAMLLSIIADTAISGDRQITAEGHPTQGGSAWRLRRR